MKSGFVSSAEQLDKFFHNAWTLYMANTFDHRHVTVLSYMTRQYSCAYALLLIIVPYMHTFRKLA